MAQFTAFGLVVKKKLLDLGKPSKWLEDKVRDETGLYIDNAYLSKTLTGKVAPKKIIDAICKILDIEEPGAEDAKTKN